MTYSAGSTILASDYNTFVTAATNSVNAVGNAYSQSQVAGASSGTTVTASQWATLVNYISKYGSHTNTAITSRSAPTTGQTISILSAVQTDLNNCYTNRFNAATQGTQYTGWTGTNSLTGGKTAGAWTITFTNTVTFANSTAATSFFQGGGTIKIQLGKSSTGNTGDPEWNDLAATLCGVIYITTGTSTVASQTIAGTSYTGVTKVGGTGVPNTLSTGTGWSNLVAGAAATVVYKQFADSAPYTGNYIQHAIAKDATSSVLTITTTWYNAEGDPISGGTAASGATVGTAPCTVVTYFPPETTNLTNTWGTPTVAATTA